MSQGNTDMNVYEPEPQLPQAPAPARSADRPRPVFVSYSRREFYFAEAMTAALRHHPELDPWFDVERLRPGTDWAEALDTSLEDADSLLLLASPAALASEYVRHEWTRALERGIPLYIGVVEAVELPPELSSCPAYDLRTRFFARALTLGKEMAQGHVESTTPPPIPSRSGLPSRLPAPIATIVALSLLTSITLVWMLVALVSLDIAVMRMAWNPFDDSVHWMYRGSALDVLRSKQWTLLMFVLLGLTALALPLVAYVLVPGAGVMRRRSDRLVVTLGFVASTAVGTFLFIGVMMYLEYGAMGDPALSELVHPMPAHVTEAAEALRAPAAGVVVCSAIGAAVVGKSRTLHLWSPTGSSVGFYRAQIVRGRPTRRQLSAAWKKLRSIWGKDSSVGSATTPPHLDQFFVAQWILLRDRAAALSSPEGGASVTFAVVHTAPADAIVADHLTWAFQNVDMDADPAAAQWVLVLVSSQASWKETARAVRTFGPRAVCVLVDTMALPPDAEPLRRQQWLDFRERRAGALFDLITKLRSPEAEHTEEELPPTPTITHRFLAPRAVRYCVLLCVNIPFFFLGFSLVSAVLRPLEVQSTLLMAVAALLAVFFARLGIRIARRSISSVLYLGYLGVLSILMLLWSAVAAAVLWIPIDRSSPWQGAWYSPPWEHLLALSGISGVVSLALLVVMPSLTLILAFVAFQLAIKKLWLLPESGAIKSPHSASRIGAALARFWPMFAVYGIFLSFLMEFVVEYT